MSKNGINVIGYNEDNEGGVLLGFEWTYKQAKKNYERLPDNVKQTYPSIALHEDDDIGTLIRFLRYAGEEEPEPTYGETS